MENLEVGMENGMGRRLYLRTIEDYRESIAPLHPRNDRLIKSPVKHRAIDRNAFRNVRSQQTIMWNQEICDLRSYIITMEEHNDDR